MSISRTMHEGWRMLPAGMRRAAFHGATAWLAPRPDQPPPPPAQHGVAVGGEV